MVSLRVLTAEDWSLWEKARVAALAEAPQAFKSRVEDWPRGDRERWRARMGIPGSYNVVALRGDDPVGMVRGVPGDGETCELRSLWVRPDLRGEGLGDRLIEAVATWARRSDFVALRLAVIPGNEPALGLYRRHGFSVTEQPGELLPDGVIRELVMVKGLR
ncbi:GNAT family N-acetyltransferase [Streptomyces durbertensis]|uniref:GNAT family N-acetyltransferase n=1 Tax=Streptomyces durbertensis TaxID=2448886 RepID=A0ABR6EDF8_9ACTN|nr:GNAT family N-acetyltransferase [Streptomyces durbertensis]MBB1243364.1 GNAT family N-acetyltransferase [Streptomyces durbertensis]